MYDQDLFFAIQCCRPNDKANRKCNICPLSDCDECHAELCKLMLDYVDRSYNKANRLWDGINDVASSLDNLRNLL